MAEEWDVQICCMGAGYVGGPTMAVIAKNCPKVGKYANVPTILGCRFDIVHSIAFPF